MGIASFFNLGKKKNKTEFAQGDRCEVYQTNILCTILKVDYRLESCLVRFDNKFEPDLNVTFECLTNLTTRRTR